MKTITFKKLTIKNFLSIGSEPTEINFKEGVNYITGENLDVPGTNNGSGKCLDKFTNIEISAEDAILSDFKNFLMEQES